MYPSERPLCGADSTGRRNTLLELLGWREVVQCLSWSLIEFSGDGVEAFLAVDGEVGSFGEGMAQEPVGVLIGAPLPGAVRVAEVDVEIGGELQALVVCEFLAAVPGQREAELSRQMPNLRRQCRHDRLGFLAAHLASMTSVCAVRRAWR